MTESNGDRRSRGPRMALAFRCTQCGQTYTKDDDWAGKIIHCDGCGKAMRIPTIRVGIPIAAPQAEDPGPAPEWGKPARPLTAPVRPATSIRRGRSDDEDIDD